MPEAVQGEAWLSRRPPDSSRPTISNLTICITVDTKNDLETLIFTRRVVGFGLLSIGFLNFDLLRLGGAVGFELGKNMACDHT